MTRLDELKQLTANSRGKALPPQVKFHVAEILDDILHDPTIITQVCQELSQLVWIDVVPLLEPRWHLVQQESHNVIIRELWASRNRDAEGLKALTTGRIRLAAAIQREDPSSAKELLDVAYRDSRARPELFGVAVGREWLRARKDQDKFPFEGFRLEDFPHRWRMEFVGGLISEVLNAESTGDGKRIISANVRERLSCWIDSFPAVGPREKETIATHVAKLNGRPVHIPPSGDRPSSPAVEMQTPPANSQSDEKPTVQAALTSVQLKTPVSSAPMPSEKLTTKGITQKLLSLANSLRDTADQEAIDSHNRELDLRKRLKEAQEAAASLRHNIEGLQHERETQTERMQSLSDAAKRLDADCENAQQRASEFEKQLHSMQAERDKAEARVSESVIALQSERDHLVREREVVKRDARRVMSEQIAAAIEHEVATIFELEKLKTTSEQELMLRRVVIELLERLRTQGIQLGGK